MIKVTPKLEEKWSSEIAKAMHKYLQQDYEDSFYDVIPSKVDENDIIQSPISNKLFKSLKPFAYKKLVGLVKKTADSYNKRHEGVGVTWSDKKN